MGETEDLPSSGQTVMKETISDTMLNFWYARLTIDNVTSLAPNHMHSHMTPSSTLPFSQNNSGKSTLEPIDKPQLLTATTTQDKQSAPSPRVAHRRESLHIHRTCTIHNSSSCSCCNCVWYLFCEYGDSLSCALPLEKQRSTCLELLLRLAARDYLLLLVQACRNYSKKRFVCSRVAYVNAYGWGTMM